jgi:hypothetical protein
MHGRMLGAAAAIAGGLTAALAVMVPGADAQLPAVPDLPNPVDLVPHAAPAPLTAGDWPLYGFGASANLVTGPDGRKLVGEGQKDGTYWAVDRQTMAPVWSQTAGPGSQLGGIIGSTAYDGTRIYGPNTPAGEQWALTPSGTPAWLSSDGGPLVAPVG